MLSLFQTRGSSAYARARSYFVLCDGKLMLCALQLVGGRFGVATGNICAPHPTFS